MSVSNAVDECSLVLQHEEMQLRLHPGRGGAIGACSWRGLPVFRPTRPDAGNDPFQYACFPLVPYANRIANGRFAWGERSVQLQRNCPGQVHPLHGQGWRAQWEVVATSASHARMRFEGGGDEWPWRYRAEQLFQLDSASLAVELMIENLGTLPMPAMLGLHPYFHDAAHAQLRANLPRVWQTDAESLPLAPTATPPDWRFDPGRAVGLVPLDHCFAGWDGVAMLRWPDRVVSVAATRCRFLHVYAPAGQDFFCIEPQTAAVGALGRHDDELALVQPGARIALQVSFAVGAA